MGMSTTYDAGVARKYMLSNASIQDVGSLLIAKTRGSTQINARPESEDGGIR